MQLKFTSNGVFVLALIASFSGLYTKFADARSLPKHPDAVMYKSGSALYREFAYMDANFDGYVTRHEFKQTYTYNPTLEDYDFARSLNYYDRLLVDGLTVKVAQFAIQNIGPDQKKKLLELDMKTKVDLINKLYQGA